MQTDEQFEAALEEAKRALPEAVRNTSIAAGPAHRQDCRWVEYEIRLSGEWEKHKTAFHCGERWTSKTIAERIMQVA